MTLTIALLDQLSQWQGNCYWAWHLFMKKNIFKMVTFKHDYFFGLHNHDVLSSEKRYVPLQMFTHVGILSWVLIQNQHGLLNRVPNISANCLDTWLKGKEIAEAKRERIKTNCIVPDTSCHNLYAFLQFPNVLILVNMARFYVVINGSCCMQQIIQLQNW